jgi:hypothetical protein
MDANFSGITATMLASTPWDNVLSPLAFIRVHWRPFAVDKFR